MVVFELSSAWNGKRNKLNDFNFIVNHSEYAVATDENMSNQNNSRCDTEIVLLFPVEWCSPFGC